MNKEPITLHLETFNNEEYILADECIKAIGIHRKTNTKLHKEIERLNNNWNELRKWVINNKHNENTKERYLVVDYGTLLDKMSELKGSDKSE